MQTWNSATHIDYITYLVNSGGPEAARYDEVDEWIRCFYAATDAGSFNGETLSTVRQVMRPVLCPETMHGWAYCKPRGYAGDFEMIDRHYLSYVCPDARLANWDQFWHVHPEAEAVRNRKYYFHDLLCQHCTERNGKRLDILNLASGPARDVFEFVSITEADVHFDCIDHDPQAVEFAGNLCRPFADRITFTRADVVRLHRSKKYDLIWAAGLFDYFSDSLFKRVLRRLLSFLLPGGELVIGNFSPANPNIAWLRFCEWHLHHRSADHLKRLAIESGVQPDQVAIGQEPEGVNLFLHIGGVPITATSAAI